MVSFYRIRFDTGLKIFIAYYLLHIVGMFYSSNIHYGLMDLQTKLLFLLAPLVLAGLSITTKSFERIKKIFVVACIITLVVLLILSVAQYIQTRDFGSFFYIKFSHGYHTTYLSIYFTLALLVVLENIFSGKALFQRSHNFFWLFFLYGGILILSARTSTVTALLMIIIFPVIIKGALFQKRFWLKYLLTIFTSLVLLFAYLQINNRFNQVEEVIEQRESVKGDEILKAESPNSTNIRLNLWQNAIQLIKRNPILGVGTGDIKEELVKIYTENNYEYGIKERISPHNQFLHTGVILGGLGILLLLTYLVYPLFFSLKQRDWLYFFFLMSILMNCMTESLLERQAGILFFTVFNTCFYLRLLNQKIIKN
jgi:O-antigen ligase